MKKQIIAAAVVISAAVIGTLSTGVSAQESGEGQYAEVNGINQYY